MYVEPRVFVFCFAISPISVKRCRKPAAVPPSLPSQHIQISHFAFFNLVLNLWKRIVRRLRLTKTSRKHLAEYESTKTWDCWHNRRLFPLAICLWCSLSRTVGRCCSCFDPFQYLLPPLFYPSRLHHERPDLWVALWEPRSGRRRSHPPAVRAEGGEGSGILHQELQHRYEPADTPVRRLP